MPAKIVLKKFENLSHQEDSEDIERKYFEKQKSLLFKNRIFKKGTSKNEIQFIKSRFHNGFGNFKKNWFCKSCHHIFHLKPQRKYKTLLEYGLNCQNCQSNNIMHGEELSKAIRNGIPISEIAELFKDKSSEMEFALTRKSKYYLMISKEASIETQKILFPLN